MGTSAHFFDGDRWLGSLKYDTSPVDILPHRLHICYTSRDFIKAVRRLLMLNPDAFQPKGEFPHGLCTSWVYRWSHEQQLLTVEWKDWDDDGNPCDRTGTFEEAYLEEIRRVGRYGVALFESGFFEQARSGVGG